MAANLEHGRPDNLDTIVLRFAVAMDALTINEAAETTGWSPRMLRYVERVGLVEPRARRRPATASTGPAELQRLRTLRELLARLRLGLSDVAFALRLRRRPALRAALDALARGAAERAGGRPAADWLRWEQEKHQRLLATATPPNDSRRPLPHDRHRDRRPRTSRSPTSPSPSSAARRSRSPSTRCPA